MTTKTQSIIIMTAVADGMNRIIKKVRTTGPTRLKLFQLGFMEGKPFKVIRHAPLQGPIMVEIDDREIAISLKVARHIMVELFE